MSSNARRIAAGLAAGMLLASIGPITAAIGGYSGTTLFSGNVGPLSASVGTTSGSVVVNSGNVPFGLGSGNASASVFAGVDRGAYAEFFGRDEAGLYGMWLQVSGYGYGSGSSSVWRSSYGSSRSENLWVYAYRCDPGCRYVGYRVVRHTFTMDPTLKIARLDAMLEDSSAAVCSVRVLWDGGSLNSGQFLYGQQSPYWIWESAYASAYRSASSDLTGTCLPPTASRWGATYMGLYGGVSAYKPFATPL